MDPRTKHKLRKKLSDKNDQLTQEPVLGDSPFTFKPPDSSEESVHVPSGLRPGRIHMGKDQDTFSRYDKYIQRPVWSREDDDIEELRAKGQSRGNIAAKAFTQAILGQVIGGTIANVGYLFDVPGMIRQFTDSETEWGENWLSNIGNWVQKKTMEDWAPVYQTREAQKGWAPWDKTWWGSMAPSIFSTASLLLPVLGTVKGVSLAGRALGIGAKMSASAKMATQTIGSSIASRHMYSTTESYELFNRMKEQYISEGRTEREARLLAGEGASHNYKLGYMNLWKDMLTWGMILRGFNFASAAARDKAVNVLSKKAYADTNARKALEAIKGGTAKLSKSKLASQGIKNIHYGRLALLEGLEEYNIQWQKKEGERKARRSAGELTPQEEAMTFFDRIAEHTMDRHTWDSFFWGTFGGLTFGALSRVGASVMNKTDANSMPTRLDAWVDNLENQTIPQLYTAAEAALEGDTKTYNESIDASIHTLGLSAAHNQTLGLEIEFAEIISNATAEQLQEAGLSPNAAENAKMALPKLRKIESVYNKYVGRNYNTENDLAVANQLAALELKIGNYKEYRARDSQEIDQYTREMATVPENVSDATRQSIKLNSKREALQADMEHLKQLLRDVERDQKEGKIEGAPIIKDAIEIQEREIKETEAELQKLDEAIKNLGEEQLKVDSEYYKLSDPGLVDLYTSLIRTERTLEQFQKDYNNALKPEEQKKIADNALEYEHNRRIRSDQWKQLDKNALTASVKNLLEDVYWIEKTKDGREAKYKGQFSVTLKKNDGTTEQLPLAFESISDQAVIKARILKNGKVSNLVASLHPDGTITGQAGFNRWANPKVIKSAEQVRNETINKLFNQVYGTFINQLNKSLTIRKHKLRNHKAIQSFVLNKISKAHENTSKRTRVPLSDPNTAEAVTEALNLDKQDTQDKAALVLSSEQLKTVKEFLDDSIENLKAEVKQASDRLTEIMEDIRERRLDKFDEANQALKKYVDETQVELQKTLELRDDLVKYQERQLSYMKGLHTRLKKLTDRSKAFIEVLEQEAPHGTEANEALTLSYNDRLLEITEEIENLKKQRIPAAERKLRMTEEQLEQNKKDVSNLQEKFDGVVKSFNRRQHLLEQLNETLEKELYKAPSEAAVGDKDGIISKRDIESEIANEDVDSSFKPPLEPFNNNISSLSRTSVNIREYIDDMNRGSDRFEPQVLYHRYINNYNVSSGEASLLAYNRRVMLEDFGDVLTESQKDYLTSEEYQDAVFVVLADNETGKPKLVDSILNKDEGGKPRKTIMFAPINGVKRDANNNPLNERFASEHPLVDLGKYSESDFREVAEQYQKEVLNPVLESDSPLTFEITALTPGIPAKNAAGDMVVTTAGQSLVNGDANLRHAKVRIAWSDELDLNTGVQIPAKRGHVYFNHKGTLQRAQREKLKPVDIERITGLVQLALTRKTTDAAAEIIREINQTAYMLFYDKKGKETDSDYRFYVESERIAGKDNITGVVAGGERFSKEQLLNPAENAEAIQKFQDFLSTKYYNVDAKSLQPHNEHKKVPGDYQVKKANLKKKGDSIVDGEMVTERTYTAKEGGYLAFLLHSDNPKLQVRLPALPKDGVDAVYNPQIINRALKFVPSRRPAGTQLPFESTEAQRIEEARKPATPAATEKAAAKITETPVTDRFVEDLKGVTTSNQISEAVSSLVERIPDSKQEQVTSIHRKHADKIGKAKTLRDQKNTAYLLIKELETEGLFATEAREDVITPETREDTQTERSDDPYNIDKNVSFEKAATAEIGTERDRAEGLEAFKRILPDTIIRIVERNMLEEGVDAKITATKDSATVLVAKTAAPMSEMHEAWHAINRLFTTPTERTLLYDEVRHVLGNQRIKVRESEHAVRGKDLTNLQAEEFLAEEFRTFMLVGRDNYVFGADQITKRNIFRRIWDGIIDLVLGKLSHKDLWLRRDPMKVIERFEEVAAGEYRMADRVDRSDFTLYKIEGETSGRSRLIVESFNYYFFEELNSKFVQGYSDLTETTMNNIYDTIKEKVDARLDIPVFKYMSENWGAVIREHAKFLRQYTIKVDIETKLEHDEKLHKDNRDMIESNRISAVENMPNAVKLLIAGLPLERGGNRTTITVPFARTIGILYKELANLPDEKAVIEKLEELSKTRHPEFRHLLDRLGIDGVDNITPTSLSTERANLQAMFFTHFHKSNNNYITTIISDEAHIYNVDATESTLESQLLDRWKNNVKTGIGNNIGMKVEDLMYLFPETITTEKQGKEAKKKYDTYFKNNFSSLFKPKHGTQVLNTNFNIPIVGKENINIKDATVNKIDKHLSRVNDKLQVYTAILNAFGITVSPRREHYNLFSRSLSVIFSEIRKAVREAESLNRDISIEDIFNRDVVHINKEIKDLVALEAQQSDHFVDNQIQTQRGTTEYSLMEKNNIGKLVDKLNTGNIPEHLIPFDPATEEGSVATLGSTWISYIQSKGKNAIRKTIIRNLGPEVGDKTDIRELSPTDYQVAFINNTLNGNFPFLRAAERGLEYGLHFGKDILHDRLVDEGVFSERFKNYLRGEIVSALAFRHDNNAKHFVKGKFNTGLSFFRDLMPNLDKALKTDTRYDNVAPKDWIATADKIMKRRDQEITEGIRDLISNKRTNTLNLWIQNEIVTKEGDNSYRIPGISKEILKNILGVKNNVLTANQLKHLVDYFNYHHLSSFIEQTKLIVGDPLTYQKEPGISDLFKRTTTFASTISGMVNHDSFIGYLNARHPRLDNTLHNKNYKDIVYKDVEVKSTMLDLLTGVLGKEKAKAYAKMAENDAAGWSTLDGYKSFYLRAGLWNNKLERAWQHQAQILGRLMVKSDRMTVEHFRDVFKEHIPEGMLDNAHLVDKTYFKRQTIKARDINDKKMTALPISKPQGTGPIRNREVLPYNRMQITKTGLSPLLPTDFLHSEEMLEFIMDATQEGVDFIFPESAKKGDILGNKEGDLSSFYNEDGSINKISNLLEQGHLLEEISWNDIGNQLEMHPEGKNKVTKSTQDRRLRWIDIFDAGKARDEFKHLPELYKENTRLERMLVEKGLSRMVNELGYTLQEGTTNDYRLSDKSKFREALVAEFNKRTMPDNIAEGIDLIIQAHKQAYFDTLPTKRQVVNVLQGMIRSRAISIKVSGDMFTQESSTGYGSRAGRVGLSSDLSFYKLLDKEGNEITDIKDYSKRASVAPMEVMISLPPQWIEFVERHEGFEGTFEQRLEQFNNKIHDPKWAHYENFKKLRHLTGIRIPGQGRNSMESMDVARYLSPFGGPRIVLPSEIVAKTGSDFDIDKLTVYISNYVKPDGQKGLPQYIEYVDKDPSVRQIENRLMEIMSEVTQDINNFESLVTPNETGVVKEQADKIMKTPSTVNHDLLSFDHNMRVAENYWDASTLISATAIHNVAHATNQESPIKIGSPVVRLFFDDFKGLSPTEFYLGHHKDSDGLTISENINNIINATLDASKEAVPSIKRINLTQSTMNSYMILNRLGHDNESGRPRGMRLLTEFFTQPVILNFERRRSIKEATLNNYKPGFTGESVKETAIEILKEQGVQRFKDLKKNTDYTFLYETFNEYMSHDHRLLGEEGLAREKQKVIEHLDDIEKRFGNISNIRDMKNRPLAMMEYYLYYKELGKVLNNLQTLTRPDAAMAKDRETIRVRKNRMERLKASEVFNPGDIDRMFENTFVGAFQNIHETAIPLFKDHFFTEAEARVEEVIWGKDGIYHLIDNPALARPEDKVVAALHKIQNGLVTHLLHTTIHNGRKINSRYKDLAIGENSLPKRTPKIKELVERNMFLDEITPVINEYIRKRNSNSGIHYLKINYRTFNVQDSNTITDSIRELLDHSNEEVRQYARDLIEFSFIQSGTQTNFTSFFELLPAEYYQPVAYSILNEYTLDRRPITKNAIRDVFANLAYDPNVVPRRRDRKLYKNLINNGKTLKVFQEASDALHPFLVVERNSVSATEAKELKAQGIRVPKETLLFERGKLSNKNYHYVRIPLRGEPMRFQEHYGMPDAPSILDYNNIPEVSRKEAPPDIGPPAMDIETYHREAFGEVTAEDVVGRETTQQTTQEGQLSMFSDRETLPSTQFTTSTTSGYPQRTRENASADATIALAVDFTSAGERLTKRAVKEQGKQYIPIDANQLEVTEERVRKIVERLKQNNVKSLNIAGNGIYTMKGKYTQQQVDEFTYDLIRRVNELYPIESIRTGGQTGFDEAGAKAGMRLGIPTRIHAPKDWVFKRADGTTVRGEQAFKARFVGRETTPTKQTSQEIIERSDRYRSIGLLTEFSPNISKIQIPSNIKPTSTSKIASHAMKRLLYEALESFDLLKLDSWLKKYSPKQVLSQKELSIFKDYTKANLLLPSSTTDSIQRWTTLRDKVLDIFTDKLNSLGITYETVQGYPFGLSEKEARQLRTKFGPATNIHEATKEKLDYLLSLQTPNRDSGMYQTRNITDIQPDAELNRTVDRFFESIGVTKENVAHIKNRMGEIIGDTNKGAIAMADIANKTVQVIENRADITSLPEEAAHFYVEMLPDSHPLYRKMMSRIKNYKMYDQVVADYGEVYNHDETLLKKEAVGKIIAQEMVNNHQLSQQQKKEVSNWWRALWNFIRDMFTFDTSYKRAAYDIMGNNLENIIVRDIERTGAEMLQTPTRREVLDDVYQATVQQQKREARQKQNMETLKNTLPEATKENATNNENQLKDTGELEGVDLVKQEILTNFEKYFPAYEYFSPHERQAFVEAMSEGELNIIC